MKQRFLPILLVLALAVSAAPAAPAAAGQAKKLPPAYRTWLEDEVEVIISPKEREVFLKLQTDRERDLFIEAFWKQRDPTPGTAANEFKSEHYRRLAHADRVLGRDSTRPGRRTDRGRIYIILGEPNDVQGFTAKSSTYDAEIWFYQDKAPLGLPAGFNVVFFRRNGTGEYRLYNPVADGPAALLAGYIGNPDPAAAYEKLRDAEPNLAEVSLNLVPGESSGTYGQPSLSSDILLRRIAQLPASSVASKYAEKFLEYKDVVDVEYTANYFDSDSLVKVFRDPSGLYFVHYAVEFPRLSVLRSEDRYATTLQVNGRVTAPDGRLVLQFDRTVALDLDSQQLAGASRQPFDFQDIFPLVDGDYRLSLLIKNEVSKEFTSSEQALRIPQPGAALQMTQPLLGYRAAALEPAARRMKAFRVGGYQIYGQPGRTFVRSDTLAVAFGLYNVPDDLASSGEVRIEFLNEGRIFRTITKKPADYPDRPDFLEQVPLADFPPAHYTVKVAFVRAGAELVSAAEEFDLSFAESLPRPWLSSRVHPPSGDPSYMEATAVELSNLGRFAEARAFFEAVLARTPGSEAAAAGLARADLGLDDAPAAVKALAPFVAESRSPQYETLVLAAQALKKTGDPGQAAGLLDRAVAHFGVNAALMNALGECYESLAKSQEALAAYEKSLQLSPDQPRIKERVDALKKKAGR
jgi:GWxTD domain-containing protein